MREVTFALGKKLKVLDWRAERINYPELERETLEDIFSNLTQDDVVFDIGAEQGEFSCLYAQVAKEVHLFEPTPEMWANIKNIFVANGLKEPKCFHGFVADYSTPGAKYNQGFEPCQGEIRDESMFSVVVERPDIETTTIDDYVQKTGAIPTVIMVDVEGAETLVIRGARETLALYTPIVYISVHPDVFFDKFKTTQQELFSLMEELGYDKTFIHYDHECHWRFE